jgi:aryl sulfotransferase
MASELTYPVKTREMQTNHFDSTIWNDLVFRDDDIIISTYAKSGTTWMQQMVGQMLFGPDPELPTGELSPWVDLRVPPKAVKLPDIEAQVLRRFLKTHLPVDTLVFSPKAKYLYIGRDGRDVVWSLHNHHLNGNEAYYDVLNNSPGLVGPPMERCDPDIHRYWHTWLERDGHPHWSLWDNVRSWWAIRDLPNVKMIHFNDLKRDMRGQMAEIAEFLGIDLNPDDWDEIALYCSFDWMRAHGEKAVPLGGAIWEGGVSTFINKGVNGRWQSVLSDAESAAYEARAIAELGEECARWLASGERV